jgi:GNAT superfamily N-acetyltransferase
MTNQPDYTIQKGIKPEHRDDAARLYAEAFKNKFEKLLGTPDEVTEILKDSINASYAFTAVSITNELFGLVGFYHKNSSLMDIKLKKLIRKYGFFSGLYKKLVIFILFFKKRDNNKQLLMDGIVTKKEHRGKGIGTGLMDKLDEFALENKMTSIKLDVVYGNDDAKRMYENRDFKSTGDVRNPGFIKRLIGVEGLTTMVKTLDLI